jgi:hypothetical protein
MPNLTGLSSYDVARNADVRDLFAPFTTPGYMVRQCVYEEGGRTPTRCQWRRSSTPQWLFLSLPRDTSYDLRSWLAVATDPENDRPHWPKPQTPEDWQHAEQLFALYTRLVPIWWELRPH